MIPELVNLFGDETYVELLRQKLPRAFEVADAESRRIQQRKGGNTYESVGQEVGVLRERILVAFLRRALGDIHIELPTANTSMRDVLVFGKPLEIKTVTGTGKVKVKWTADTLSAQKDIESFEFTSDILLVRIWWGYERESLFHIPVEALADVADGLEPGSYITGAAGTNNRGIEFANSFLSRAEKHPYTTRVRIDWKRSDIRLDPMERWLGYWSNTSGRDPLYM